MFYKARLTIGGVPYDMTDADLKNWSEMEIAFKRSSFDGVVRSFANKFEFVGTAYKKLYDHFISVGFGFDAKLEILVRNSEWVWEELYSCSLDASTIEYDGYVFSASATSGDIASMIAARKSTKYEYEAGDMAREVLTFDRIPMNNFEEFCLTPSKDNFREYEIVETGGAQCLPVYTTNDSIPIPGKVFLFDQEAGEPYVSPKELFDSGAPYFLEAQADVNVRVRFEMRLKPESVETLQEVPHIILYKWQKGGGFTEITCSANFAYREGDSMEIKVDKEIMMAKYERLSLIVFDNSPAPYGYLDVNYTTWMVENYKYDTSGFTLRVDWEDTGMSAKMECIKPVTLLDKLLESMCGTGVKGVIEDDQDGRLTNCRLVPAECARAISGAKVYSNFTTFCTFMETLFGYVYEISGNNVVFRHRNEMFRVDECKMIGSYKDLSVSADSGKLYSAVEIGHDAIDYGEDNGRNEYNVKHTYTTGNTYSDSVLKMDTGYRVDSYGLEYLVEKRTEDQKDDKGDSDIIAIHTNGDSGNLKPDSSVFVSFPPVRNYDTSTDSTGRESTIVNIGVIYEPKTGAVNTYYHPYYCAMANAQYLATFADELTFASSDAGNSVYFNGKNMERDIYIGDYKKYSPMNVSFKTNEIDVPADPNAKVGFIYKGKTYEGWLTDLKISDIREKETTYKLMMSTEIFAGNAENNDKPVIVPGGTQIPAQTIYIKGSWIDNGDGTLSSFFRASSASRNEYTIRASIVHYDNGEESVQEYEYYKVEPGVTEITGSAHVNPHYSEVRAIKKSGTVDKNTYIANYVNNVSTGERPDAVDVKLSVNLMYDTRLRKTEISTTITQNAVEDIVMDVVLRSSFSDDTATARVVIPTGSSYATPKVYADGDFNRMDTPVFSGLTRTNITFAGYMYSMITTVQTPDEIGWLKPVITGVQVADIKADGSNTVSKAIVSWSQSDNRGNTTSGTENVSFQVVSASATTNTERTKIATRQAVITVNGVESDIFDVDVYQEAYVPAATTWNAPVITGCNVADIESGGGSVSSCLVSYHQTNSKGETSYGSKYVTFDTVSATANTGSARIYIASRVVSVTVNGKTSAGFTVDVYQKGYSSVKTLTVEVVNNGMIEADFDITIDGQFLDATIEPEGTVTLGPVQVQDTNIEVMGSIRPSYLDMLVDIEGGGRIVNFDKLKRDYTCNLYMPDNREYKLTIILS